jgi:hypothetical protein
MVSVFLREEHVRISQFELLAKSHTEVLKRTVWGSQSHKNFKVWGVGGQRCSPPYWRIKPWSLLPPVVNLFCPLCSICSTVLSAAVLVSSSQWKVGISVLVSPTSSRFSVGINVCLIRLVEFRQYSHTVGHLGPTLGLLVISAQYCQSFVSMTLEYHCSLKDGR